MQIWKDDAIRHPSVWSSDEIRGFNCVSVFFASLLAHRKTSVFFVGKGA
jgi:hypothetical protein